MRVDQMGVNPYDGLYVCGRAHVDMGHACMSVISCDIHCTRMWINWSHMTYLGQVQQIGGCCQRSWSS